MLQQYLPLAVLKPVATAMIIVANCFFVATVPTACGIETLNGDSLNLRLPSSCNSTYRLRY